MLALARDKRGAGRRGRRLASAPVFAALGDATRLRIVERLATGEPLSIASLTMGTGVTRQAISKHLHVLDDAGLVRSNWQGRERQWELDPSHLLEARRTLDEICAQWGTALRRLKAFVERNRT
jgi:DNA-binding transcriptional ArsR family regulator